MKVVLVWYMADFVAWNCLHITNNLRAPLNEIIYIYIFFWVDYYIWVLVFSKFLPCLDHQTSTIDWILVQTRKDQAISLGNIWL